MDWVSFDEIKKLVPLERVIDRYGIPLRRVNVTTLRGQCPLPTHGSEKSRESFTATLSKGVGGAWACQSHSCAKARGRVGGNVLDFVAAMEQCSVRDAAIKLQTWFLVPAAGQSITDRKEPRPEISAGKEPKRESVVAGRNSETESPELNKPLSFELQNVDLTHAYVKGRGVTEETAEKFGVGFFPGRGSMSGRVVLPIHNAKGDLVAYAGRVIDATEPKYKFPSGFHKSLELFNLHRVRGEVSVILVEGFFDCINLAQAGYPCVALMGSTMSQAQEALMRDHFGHVVVLLDGDEAGKEAAEGIAERLQRVVYQVHLVELPHDVQPDQLSSDELHALLDAIPGLR